MGAWWGTLAGFGQGYVADPLETLAYITDLLSCFTIFPIYRRFVYYQTDSRLNLNYQSYY